MRVFNFSFVSVVFALVMSVPVAADQHLAARHLIAPVGDGQKFSCQLAPTKERLKAVLDSAGWNNDGYPDVDWGEEAAIVISPRLSYNGADMEFRGLSRRSDGIHILYGWKERKGLSSGMLAEGTSSLTGSSVNSGGSILNDILIVAIPQNIFGEVSHCTRYVPPWESR